MSRDSTFATAEAPPTDVDVADAFELFYGVEAPPEDSDSPTGEEESTPAAAPVSAPSSPPKSAGVAVGTTRPALAGGSTVSPPAASDFQAIAAARSALTPTVSRGLTLSGAVGAVASGNAIADVRVVQRRLVDVGKLSSNHREAPPDGATGTLPQTSLRATIAAIRGFQQDVAFWKGRGVVSGAITPGVVAPGDASAALLDRIAVYTTGSGPSRIAFRDHVVSTATVSADGVMFVGTASPSAMPAADYEALGLTKPQAAALKFVSAHEGNFDAINTYDRALVSVGFIQFAGSRGLPPYLALLKARQPASFRSLLQKFGIDVEFTVSGNAITAPRVVVLDAAASTVRRAADAERAIRDDKTLSTALILSGRERNVQLAQIEAAIRDYVLPALASTVSWGPGAARAALRDLLRSQKSMAALFDRAIQEGLAAARRRFERVIRRMVRGSDSQPPPPPSLADLQKREGDILAELERDLQAAVDVFNRIGRARTALESLARSASAAGATLAAVVARPELSDARRAVTDAKAGLSAVNNVTTPRGSTVEATLSAIGSALAAEESRLALVPPPATTTALAATLGASRKALATAAAPLSTAPMFLARIQKIRRSTLDASLAELAEHVA